MSRHKTMFLVNPSADKGSAWKSIGNLKPLVEEFGGADWAGTVYPGHATVLANQAAEAGYELVIAAGGDGTVHEVINGLMCVPFEARPRLGIVPLGSGNDFAHSIGIRGTPTEALNRIFTGKNQRMDLGTYEIGKAKREYFNNTFGMGFDATVTIHTQHLTYLRGFLMYFVAVLQTIALNHEAPKMHIVTDSESWDEETIMLVACNAPREGGGFAVAPSAVISDGYLNYASVCHVSRLMMLRLIPEVMKGTHGRFKQVRLGKFRQLKLQSECAITMHADGEVIRGFGTEAKDVKIEVVPEALEIIT